MAAFAFIARDFVPDTTYQYTQFLSYYIAWVYNSLLFLWAQMWTIFRKKCYNLPAWYVKASVFPPFRFLKEVSHKSIFQFKSKAVSLWEKKFCNSKKLPIFEQTKYLEFYLHELHLLTVGSINSNLYFHR